MDSERRVFDRFSVNFPTKFKDTRSDFGKDVFLRDVSAGGANIIARDRIFFNDSIAIEIELPDGPAPLLLNGRVVWSKPTDSAMWNIGMEFDHVDFMKVQRLFKYSSTS